MSRKEWLTVAGSAGVGLALLAVLILTGPIFRRPPRNAGKTWNQEGIRAAYVAAQLHEIDKTHSSLILSYDLNNLTELDYRLAEGSGEVIISRLKTDGSLSQEEPVRLSYPVFLPAGQRARMAIEISGALAWPSQDDSRYDQKLREFVKQKLAGVRGFVVFDEASHSQINLPAVWPELQAQDTTRAGG